MSIANANTRRAPAARAPGNQTPTDGAAFLNQLFERGLLIPSDVDGLYGRGAIFEDVVERISDLIGAWGVERGADVLRFPPAISRTLLEQSGYLQNFPQLAGTVFSFCGSDLDHRSDRRRW